MGRGENILYGDALRLQKRKEPFLVANPGFFSEEVEGLALVEDSIVFLGKNNALYTLGSDTPFEYVEDSSGVFAFGKNAIAWVSSAGNIFYKDLSLDFSSDPLEISREDLKGDISSLYLTREKIYALVANEDDGFYENQFFYTRFNNFPYSGEWRDFQALQGRTGVDGLEVIDEGAWLYYTKDDSSYIAFIDHYDQVQRSVYPVPPVRNYLISPRVMRGEDQDKAYYLADNYFMSFDMESGKETAKGKVPHLHFQKDSLLFGNKLFLLRDGEGGKSILEVYTILDNGLELLCQSKKDYTAEKILLHKDQILLYSPGRKEFVSLNNF